MAWTLGEHLVTSLEAALRAGMPAKLAALNTEYGTSEANGDVLTNVVIWATSEQELVRLHTLPAVFILADQLAFAPPRQSLTMESNVRARIGVLIDDVEPDRLRLRIYRYMRAVLEVVFDAKRAGTLGGWQFGSEGVIEYSGILARESSFIIDGTLSWTYTKQEDR